MGISISSALMVGNTYENMHSDIFEWAEIEYGED